MPYSPPVESAGSPTWTVGARHGQATVQIQVIVEGAASDADGDSTLQDLVNVLTASPAFSDVNGAKTYQASTSRVMTPSA